MSAEEIRRALAAHTTLNLAYVDDAGDPQSCAVFYAPTDEGTLVFLTSRSTRHGSTFAFRRPKTKVAFTAQADDQSWTTITGLQGRGVCRPAEGETLANARASYAARFPFVAGEGPLAAALSTADYWEVEPDWLRVIDNAQGFGHKEEWNPVT
jgi:uncharacterized protein YhbP (UPF0306 family)